MDLMDEVGLGERMHREGLVHEGVELRFDGAGAPDRAQRPHRWPRDHDLRPAGGRQGPDRGAGRARVCRSCSRSPTCAVDPESGTVTYTHEGDRTRSKRDLIAGCDGFHGVCRPAIQDVLTVYERVYPFGWMGILAECAPASGGADLRAPRARVRARLDALARDHAPVPAVRAGRRAVARRADLGRARHPLRHAASTAGRSSRRASRRCARSWSSRCSTGKLYLAGDAAHIVPPTGAKGLNTAMADVALLASSIGNEQALERLHAARARARLARAALLVVDDVDAAPHERRPVRDADPALAAALHGHQHGAGDRAGGELRRLALHHRVKRDRELHRGHHQQHGERPAPLA